MSSFNKQESKQKIRPQADGGYKLLLFRVFSETKAHGNIWNGGRRNAKHVRCRRVHSRWATDEDAYFTLPLNLFSAHGRLDRLLTFFLCLQTLLLLETSGRSLDIWNGKVGSQCSSPQTHEKASTFKLQSLHSVLLQPHPHMLVNIVTLSTHECGLFQELMAQTVPHECLVALSMSSEGSQSMVGIAWDTMVDIQRRM